MIDALKRVINLKGYWKEQDFRKLLSEVSLKYPEIKNNWDGPEENWAGLIINNNEGVIFLGYLYPIIFIEKKNESYLDIFPENIEIVCVDDIHAKTINPNEDVLKQAFEPYSIDGLNTLVTLNNENESLVSLHDIWWATVT